MEIKLPEDRIERGAMIRAKVRDPPSHGWIHLVRDLLQGSTRLEIQPPLSNPLPHALGGARTQRWRERYKHLPLSTPNETRTKLIAQEGKLLGQVSRILSLYLTTHNLSFLGMQLQVIDSQPFLTQEEIAEMIGTKKPNISRLESPSGRHSPRLTTIKKYAEAAGYEMHITFKRISTSEKIHRGSKTTGARV